MQETRDDLHSIKSICIVGGGTAGWMAATLLSALLKQSPIKISVVESPDIASVGVGESTVPSIIDFLRASQIDLKDFIKQTSATFKLGIQFEEWLALDRSFFHPFGKIGNNINGFEFYNVWRQTADNGQQTSWLDYSANAVMAANNKFMLRPQRSNNWVNNSYANALHLDAVSMAKYLRNIALTRGVVRIEDTVNDAELTASGNIKSLRLNVGQLVNADFFIDCTGFKGILCKQALDVAYESWENYLPCNRAIAVQTQQTSKPVPYTVASAKSAGWCWRIPLQHRTGNGYVYASDFVSDEEALDTLRKHLIGEPITEPNFIPFASGKLNKIWHKNCLALGLAAGFVEPLESTAIHLIYKTLIHFIKHFPDAGHEPANERLFNQAIAQDYLEVRDFIVLHYCTSKRNDSEFWRWCQQMSLPDSLQQKLEGFRCRGQISVEPNQLFNLESWYSILEGMQLRPTNNNPLLRYFNTEHLNDMLQKTKSDIQQTVSEMPSHCDYIQAHCATMK